MLDAELVHVGRDASNQIVIPDESLENHHCSIVQRGGRYALFSPLPHVVAIEGTTLPADQWVWLPGSARVQLSASTSIQFDSPLALDAPSATGSAKPAEATPTDSLSAISIHTDPNATPSGTMSGSIAGKPRAKKSKKGPTSTAKFIRDRSGDQLVQLVADGRLPMLELSELGARAKNPVDSRPTSPWVLYLVLGVSFASSLLLLVFDTGNLSAVPASRRQLVAQLQPFYAQDEGILKPYQVALRQARLARSRGDLVEEKQYYRAVLRMLSAEDVNPLTGVTGTRQRDEELRSLLARLLSQ